jgi:uncharacterized protein (DUF305 family)
VKPLFLGNKSTSGGRIMAWFAKAVAVLGVLSLAIASNAQEMHHQHGNMESSDKKLGPFIASTDKPFAELMDSAMAIMDQGMSQAPMNGDADHDFVTMMIPHHQGAVDMAKAILLYSKDTELRNLAQGILVEQDIEIKRMQLWLQHHSKKKAAISVSQPDSNNPISPTKD